MQLWITTIMIVVEWLTNFSIHERLTIIHNGALFVNHHGLLSSLQYWITTLMIVLLVNKLFNTWATSNLFRYVVTFKNRRRGRGGCVRTGRSCLIGAGLPTGLCSFLILRDNAAGEGVEGGGKDGGKSSCVLSCVRTLALAYAAVIPVLAVVPEPADFATFWKRVF